MKLWMWPATAFIVGVYGFGLVARWRLAYYRRQGTRLDGAGEAAPPEVGAFGCYRCGHEGSADDPCDDEECARLGPLPWSERSDGSPPHPAQSATGDGAGEADCRGQGVVDKAGERGDSPATPLDGGR